MVVNRLNITLTLTMAGEAHEIPAGNIKNLELALEPYGFSGHLDFWLVSQKLESEDTLFAPFVKTDLIELKLLIDRTFDKVGESADPLELKGLVESRTLQERAFDGLDGAPVLHRRYAITFRDRAAVLWSQHRPVQVYADQPPKKLVDDHLPAGVKVTHDWAQANTKRPVLSVSTGADLDGASYYDFLGWLCAREGIGLFQDLKTEQYTLADKKPTAAQSIPLPMHDVALMEVVFPPIPRHMVKVLNGYSEAGTKSKDVTNSDGVAKVRQDRLLIAPVASDVDKQVKVERAVLKAPPAELSLEMAGYPSVTFRPNLVYDFSEEWSDRVFPKKGKYRLRSVALAAHAVNQSATDDTDDDSNAYEITCRGRLELQAVTAFALPPFRRPHWPFYVEGKIVSEIGKQEELTYQANKDETTSLDYYKVLIPLWAQKVIAPYNPNLFAGHFYFPAYRDERVLLALDFDRAWIKRFLDWRPGARLPAESQGNHLLLGKQGTDQTSIRHVYESAKPVLAIERTLDKDKQLIQVSEGTILLRTKEDE
jgi:hypothetical protein